MSPGRGLRGLRIGARLAGGFGLVLALMVVAIVVADTAHQRNLRAEVGALDVANRKLALAGSMKASLLEAGVAMRNIAMQSDVEGTHRSHREEPAGPVLPEPEPDYATD